MTLTLKVAMAGLMAGASLAMAAPAMAAPHRHPDRGHVVVRGPNGHLRVGRFHRFGHGPVARLTVVQRNNWRGGHWWHGSRHGRIGWWWWAGGIWYWYPAAVYPYPATISAEAVYDYAPEGRSDDSWYYCQDPKGYYPYVKSCNGEWQAVPIQPQATAGDAAYGEPPMGDDEDTSGDDENYDENSDDSGDDEGDDNGDDQSGGY